MFSSDLARPTRWTQRVNRKSQIVNSSAFAEHERDLGFADGFAADFADAFGFADLAAHFGHLDFNHQYFAGRDGFAPLDLFGGHEIRDLSHVLGISEHENSSHLGDRFELQHAGHDRMSGE